MPWSVADVDKHNKGLTPKQKKVWVEVANGRLAAGDSDASAIKQANAAVSRIKESITMIREAALRQDESLMNLRSELQDHLSSEHISSYEYDEPSEFPYVVDIFGDKDFGTVVYQVGDEYFSCSFKRLAKEDGFDFGEPMMVDRAYVPAMVSVGEALHDMPVGPGVEDVSRIMERYISKKVRKVMPSEDFAGKGTSFPIQQPSDVKAAASALGRAGTGNFSRDQIKANILAIAKRKGWERHLPKSWQNGDKKHTESLATEGEVDFESDVIELRESAVDAQGYGEVKLIQPCTGSMGHYTEEALQQADTDKVFPKGTQMFLDHQTDVENKARPEGSVRNLAAVFETDAVYKQGKDGPGLYAKMHVFPEFKDFINERAKHIGISVRAAVKPKAGAKVDGLPVVEKFVRGYSVDFVTKAGAGGKVIEMLESFRRAKPPTEERPEAAINDRSVSMEVKEGDLLRLQEAAALVPKLTARLDQLEESNQRYAARDIVVEALRTSGLKERGQKRVIDVVLTVLPIKEGKLDVDAIKASTKAAIENEIAYLKEAGVVAPVVHGAGEGTGSPSTEEGDKALQEASKLLDASCKSLLGITEASK